MSTENGELTAARCLEQAARAFGQGRLAAAESLCRQALALDNRNPSSILSNLGLVLQRQGRREEARECLEQAVTLRPEDATAWNNLGCLYRDLGRGQQGADCFRRAVALRPDYGEALSNLAITFSDEGRPEAAVQAYRQLLRLAPERSELHSNLLLILNYCREVSREDIFAEHLAWGRRYQGQDDYPEVYRQGERNNKQRLKVGYLSPDFRRHSVAAFIEPVLAAHDHEVVEVFAYANVAFPDAVTARLQARTCHWRDIARLTDQEAVALIRRDGIDILLDLAGHTAGNRLAIFARRAAPIQVTWLGYPNTTGLAAMDYRLTDVWADPPPADRFCSEQLVGLPGGFLCYQPPADCPAADKVSDGLDQSVRFISLNNFSKVNEYMLGLWGRILRQVPESRLLLKAPAGGDGQRRVTEILRVQGIGQERLGVADGCLQPG